MPFSGSIPPPQRERAYGENRDCHAGRKRCAEEPCPELFHRFFLPFMQVFIRPMLLRRGDGIVPADPVEHLDIFSVAPRCVDFQGSNLPKMQNVFCALLREYAAIMRIFPGIVITHRKIPGTMQKRGNSQAAGQAAAAAHSCAIFVLLRKGDLKYSPPRIAGAFVVSPSRLWYTY